MYFVAPWLALSKSFGVVMVHWLSVPFISAIAVRKALLLFLLFLFEELCLVVLFIVDSFEARKPLIRGHTALSFENVDHYAVRALLDSLPSKSGFFGQTPLIADVGFVLKVIDTVQELAPLPVHAVALLLVLRAHLRLVVAWQVLLWHELVGVVGVGAGVAVLAVVVHDNISAHLRLFHLLDFLVELESFLFVHELFLLRLPCGLTSEARNFIQAIVVVVVVTIVAVIVVVVVTMVVMVVVVVVETREGGVHLLEWHWFLLAV